MKDAAEKKPLNKVSEEKVGSFAKFLKDKGIEVSYVVAKEANDAEYDHDVDCATRKLLHEEMLINGVRQTPAEYIAQAQVAFVMDNPSPMNVGQLRKNIGDDVVKLDVEGMGIEKFMESVKPDDEQ